MFAGTENVNDYLAMFLGANIEWIPVASGALVVVLGGTALTLVQRRLRREDDLSKKESAALEAELVGLARRLDTECGERRAAVNAEADIRRGKDEELGRDISRIREAFMYYCGQSGKDKPKFDGSD